MANIVAASEPFLSRRPIARYVCESVGVSEFVGGWRLFGRCLPEPGLHLYDPGMNAWRLSVTRSWGQRLWAVAILGVTAGACGGPKSATDTGSGGSAGGPGSGGGGGFGSGGAGGATVPFVD